MRRFTRLTNAFSKKVENHAAAVALYFMYYNFGRVHQTLRVTPAMEAGVANHVWSVEEIVGLLDRAWQIVHPQQFAFEARMADLVCGFQPDGASFEDCGRRNHGCARTYEPGLDTPVTRDCVEVAGSGPSWPVIE